MITTYTVFSPDNLKFPLGVIDKKGNVLSGVRELDVIIANAKKGWASDKANNLLCVRNIEQPKREDVVTLGKLMGRPSKPKDRDFESNLLKRFPGSEKESFDVIRIIKSGNRYMSKTDWTSDRIKNQIQGLLAHGKSLTHIARHIGVPISTLSKANKRHNYRFYIPDKKNDDLNKKDDE